MTGETKKCPYCGEEILATAKKCKHCGEWLVLQEKDKPKSSMHFSIIVEILIGIASIPIGIYFGSNAAIAFIIVIYILLNVYFLPTLIADGKRTQYTTAIFTLNLLLGVTIVGWIGALVWALSLPNLSENIENSDNDDSKNENFWETIKEDRKRSKEKSEWIMDRANMPQEIRHKFNWGACLLNCIWGVAHKKFITLVIIPLFFLYPFLMIWFGIKGNLWAWQTNRWDNPEDFNKSQKKWALAGVIAIVAYIIISSVITFIIYKNSDSESFSDFINGNAQTIEDILKESTSQKEGYDEISQSTIYEFFADNPYNQIVKFNDRGTTVYAFRKETDTPIGNGGQMFNYELGRIKINPNDKNACQCTYNFRASLENKPVEWFKCSEKSFIKDLPKIIQVKEEKFKELKELLDYENLAEICGYAGSEDDTRCKNFQEGISLEELDYRREMKLSELRNATITKPKNITKK